jgi:Flp pilus assembly protein TadG
MKRDGNLVGGGQKKSLFAFSKRENSKGQTLIEMALITPVVILMVAGVIHFGAALNAHQIITNAAREGARIGTQVGGTASVMQQTVTDICSNAGLNTSRLSVQASPGTGPSNPSTVTVTYVFQSTLDQFFQTSGLTLQAQCVMRY